MEENSIFSDRLEDSFGRVAKKMRISVTDRCNMSCLYCMPFNNTKWFNQDNILNFEQIIRITKILSKLGIEKIKITGGEPTVRPKIEDLIKSLSCIENIKSISMTTNGLLLKDKLKHLKESGLRKITISLDTFNEKRFEAITGISGGLAKVMQSIDLAQIEGFEVKINTVIIKGWNEHEILKFAEFAKDKELVVKFIEFMPLDGTGIWNQDLVYSKKEMIEQINTHSVRKIVPLFNEKSDPARLYSFDDGKGIIGFIPSITEPFCKYCDRTRLMSNGKFYTCLFEKNGFDLKNLLHKSDDEIKLKIIENIRKKPEGIIKKIRSNSLKPKLNMMHTIGG